MKMEENKITIAAFEYEYKNGDQHWDYTTIFYKDKNGKFIKEYTDGYYGETTTCEVSAEEIKATMQSIYTKSGYRILQDLNQEIESQKTNEIAFIFNIHERCQKVLAEVENIFQKATEGITNDSDIQYISDSMHDEIKDLTNLALLKNKVEQSEKENKLWKTQSETKSQTYAEFITEMNNPDNANTINSKDKNSKNHMFKEMWERSFNILHPHYIYCSKKIDQQTLNQGINFRVIISPYIDRNLPSELSKWIEEHNCNLMLLDSLDRNTDMDYHQLYAYNRGWNDRIINIDDDFIKESDDIENDEFEIE